MLDQNIPMYFNSKIEFEFKFGFMEKRYIKRK